MKVRLFVSGVAAAAAIALAQAPGAQASAMASPKCASGDSVVWMSSDKKTYRMTAPDRSGANNNSSTYGSNLMNGGYTPVCKSEAVQMGAKMTKTSSSSGMKSSGMTTSGMKTTNSSAMGSSPAATTVPMGSPANTSGNTPGPNGAPPAHSP